jgi:hypothetical protein
VHARAFSSPRIAACSAANSAGGRKSSVLLTSS